MRRQIFKAAADDDSLPVIIPRNDEAVVPISRERVRRLHKHLVVRWTPKMRQLAKVEPCP